MPPGSFPRLGLALWLALGLACARNPATGELQLALMGEQREIALGRETDAQVREQIGLYPDETLQRYVAEIGARLAAHSERPELPWTFRVVDDPALNAFALPGGFIYLTRGILAHFMSEAQMAAVLGHEIGHVTARHSVEQYSRQQLFGLGLLAGMVAVPELQSLGGLAQAGLGLLLLKYGREDERQADDLGLRYVRRAGYAPGAMQEVFGMLARASAREEGARLPGWLSTHPDPGERAQRIAAALAEIPADGGRVARDEYLRRLEGLAFGTDPREGYFRNGRFYHPELAFQLRLPSGWDHVNQKQAVGAISPQRDAAILLTLAAESSPAAAARAFLAQGGVEAGRPVSTQIHGLTAVRMEFAAQDQQGGDLRGAVGFVAWNERVYRILGYATASEWVRYDAIVRASIESFAPLEEQRFLDVQPARLEIVRLSRSMTLRELDRIRPSSVDLETLALLNQIRPDDPLPGGQLVKRVVGGELPGD